MILGGAGGRSTRDAEIGLLPHYSVRTPSLLCHYLEANVGIAPRVPSPAENSADFAA